MWHFPVGFVRKDANTLMWRGVGQLLPPGAYAGSGWAVFNDNRQFVGFDLDENCLKDQLLELGLPVLLCDTQDKPTAAWFEPVVGDVARPVIGINYGSWELAVVIR